MEKENATKQNLITTLEQQARDLTEMITAGKDNLTNALQSANEVKQLHLQVSSLQGEKQAAAEMLDKSEKYVTNYEGLAERGGGERTGRKNYMSGSINI